MCRDLDNSLIQCVHGKIPVSKVNSAKRISAMAWQLLQSKVLVLHSFFNTTVLYIGVIMCSLQNENILCSSLKNITDGSSFLIYLRTSRIVLLFFLLYIVVGNEE